MKNEKLIKIGLILVNVLLFFILFPYLSKILNTIFKLIFPFIIGFTFAFLLLPLVNWLVKHNIKRNYAVIITVLLFFSIIVGLIVVFVPIIVNEIKFLIEHIPDYMIVLNNIIDNIKFELSFLPNELIPSIEIIEMTISDFLVNIVGNIFTFFTNFISYIITFLMSIILMIYFLLDFEKINLFLKEKVIKYKSIDLIEYFRNIKETIHAYFRGVFLVSTIVFVLSFLSFKIIGLEYALLLGLIVGITDIIPYIGPYIGGFIVSIVAAGTSLKKMILVLIIIVIIQGLESWFITPKIQSKKISVNPILVLLFLVIFGKILGVWGLLIAVPVLAIIQTTLKTRYNK